MASSNADYPPFMQQPASLLIPATVNVANFVPIKLWFSNYPFTNYVVWKEQMLCLLQSQGLLGFIDGSTSLPKTDNQEYYLAWKRTDSLVKGWILGSIDNDIASTVLPFNTSRDVWLELEKTYPYFCDPAPRLADQDTSGLDRNDNLPLYRAALKGNWEEACRIFENDPVASKTWVDELTTSLHVAVGTGKAIHFVKHLVARLPDDESIALKDDVGNTALCVAAAIGNIEAATILVNRMPSLLYIPNNSDDFPVQVAALYCHKHMVDYFMSITKDDEVPNPFAGDNGLRLLEYAIEAEFFDIALSLVDKYPYLAGLKLPDDDDSALSITIEKFRTDLGFWERFISSRIPLETTLTWKSTKSNTGDIERMANDSHGPAGVFQNLHVILWKLAKFVPRVRTIEDKIRANEQVLQLVKSLCKKLESLGSKTAKEIYVPVILRAAKLGAREVVEVIVDTFPNAIDSYSSSGKNIFHKAVAHRSEHVYNLIYQMGDEKNLYKDLHDNDYNNLLHLVGKLAPSHKLNQISGAALQMQRELQWYEAVKSIVPPAFRQKRNQEGKTPETLFTEEHKNLKEKGEKWMKDTANSCTIAAALIATVMFAAAITIPGGNQSNNGFPIFSKETTFIVFAISDAASLFTSVTSLLMFLSILTSRYAEKDFLHVLPKRLIIGLGTLFFSITFMMISFSMTLYLVFGQKKEWVIIPVAALACLPIASFVLLQFPLLFELISSTYGPGIFGKESDLPFY